jgi:3-hydroxymyristoyl/3-hydroxydecanoyl-(acyl carrier protein) dehydratase
MKWRMIDRIVDFEPWRSIRGAKLVSFEEYCAAPGALNELPRTLALEAGVQLARWLLVLSSGFMITGLPVEIGAVEYSGAVGPGQRLDLSATMDREVEIVAMAGGRRVMHVRGLVLKLQPLAELCDPADLRVLASEIQRPMAREPA